MIEKEEETISDLKSGNKEKLEAVVQKKNLQELETNLFSLVCYVNLLMPRTQAEKFNFQDFNLVLQKPKDARNSRVPNVVYRILVALEGHLSHIEEPKSGNEERKEESFKKNYG